MEWDLDYGYWIHGGGMQQRREFFVNNLDKQRNLLDDLGLHSMDELRLELKDPEWLEQISCLRHKPAMEISNKQNQNTRSFRKTNAVEKKDSLQLGKVQQVRRGNIETI
ncbi:hypothetical protein BG003_006456 [Podila horticola]|nr:hypothetical protein BG003_006456 [Podila horticola]